MVRQLISTSEAAQWLGVRTTDTIRRMLDNGEIEGVIDREGRVRARYRIYLDSVQAHPDFIGDSQPPDLSEAREAALLLNTAMRHLNDAFEAQRKALEAQGDAIALLLGPRSPEDIPSPSSGTTT